MNREIDLIQGLNLVANIVKSMDGTVRVQSEAGVGTTVTVSIPFVHCTPTPSPESRPGSPPLSRHFWTVDFVGFDARRADADVQSPEAEANIRFLQSLRHYCSELGLDVQSVGDAHGHRSTFNIVWQPALDFAYPAYSAGSRSHPLPGSRLQAPAIVMCKSRTSAIRLQSSRSAIALPDKMSFLWPPISSAKLSTAISTLSRFQHLYVTPHIEHGHQLIIEQSCRLQEHSGNPCSQVTAAPGLTPSR